MNIDSKKKPIRIAMIMGTMGGGGVESVVMNYYRNINKEKFQFDFIIDKDSSIVPELEIKKMGGNIYRINSYRNLNKFFSDLKKIFVQNHYLVVHSHINTLSVFPLFIAKKCGIPIRIAHSHSTAAPGETKKNVMKKFLRLFGTRYATHFMSPTKYAGEWLFGKQIAENQLFVLNNAINLNKFDFSESTRKMMRIELGYTDEDFVVGNIGRLAWQKNQEYLIKIFSHILLINNNARLLIIGDGPLKQHLVNAAEEYGVLKKVNFLSNRENIEDYYQAMDVFAFPSNYEGLGIVAVEAQISGLPIIVSKMVPSEAKISDNYISIPIEDDSVGLWTKSINRYANKDIRKAEIRDEFLSLYDIKIQVEKLEVFYERIILNLERGKRN